ncbi:hypothetical protein J6590_025421 [Homalodisca vitripennis]|nr:hypothetical protein J6590_025421 [Homalodisca vitripennis]
MTVTIFNIFEHLSQFYRFLFGDGLGRSAGAARQTVSARVPCRHARYCHTEKMIELRLELQITRSDKKVLECGSPQCFTYEHSSVSQSSFVTSQRSLPARSLRWPQLNGEGDRKSSYDGDTFHLCSEYNYRGRNSVCVAKLAMVVDESTQQTSYVVFYKGRGVCKWQLIKTTSQLLAQFGGNKDCFGGERKGQRCPASFGKNLGVLEHRCDPPPQANTRRSLSTDESNWHR